MVLYDRTTYLLIEGILNRSGTMPLPKVYEFSKHIRRTLRSSRRLAALGIDPDAIAPMINGSGLPCP